ncbi:hypothetical protein PGT21_001899 [Puccinia graminis f. sp. tritici]|uniref:Uncharacterized protein n=1 Tax=Puccinia graminis f. sp. tritici TaxID=56615 RepID=A0A5B0PW46_PUCGR|nr:hypothetical protein PGT21_001899 [Puccinia graminis f. sp. tritici]KAA1105104.1 hypothetical protein PGTUg99_011077 [Puccinia graminis f. sp. tritici]
MPAQISTYIAAADRHHHPRSSSSSSINIILYHHHHHHHPIIMMSHPSRDDADPIASRNALSADVSLSLLAQPSASPRIPVRTRNTDLKDPLPSTPTPTPHPVPTHTTPTTPSQATLSRVLKTCL